MLVWHYFHFYYEATLWSFSIKVGQLLTKLPLEDAEIGINGQLCCRLCNFIHCPNMSQYTVNTLLFVPLLLSSSGIRWINRLKILLLGVGILFVFQGLYTSGSG
jgi:hypothetical protein